MVFHFVTLFTSKSKVKVIGHSSRSVTGGKTLLRWSVRPRVTAFSFYKSGWRFGCLTISIRYETIYLRVRSKTDELPAYNLTHGTKITLKSNEN